MILPDNVKTILANNSQLSAFYLVEIMLDTPLHHTTYFRDVITKDGNFSADNTIMAVDSPSMSSSVDRSAYKISYADPTFAMRATIESGIAGRKVSVWAVVINTTNATVGGVAPGDPLLNDAVLVYSGYVDTAYAKLDNEESLVVIECASLMAGLDVIKSVITSPNYIKGVDANDNSFDQVYDGSRSINLVWGKR